jgi:hypothetical protein
LFSSLGRMMSAMLAAGRLRRTARKWAHPVRAARLLHAARRCQSGRQPESQQRDYRGDGADAAHTLARQNFSRQDTIRFNLDRMQSPES